MTPDRRDPKRFEPPPWERPQFEELELQRAKRAEQETAAAATAEAIEAAKAAAPEPAVAEDVVREDTAGPVMVQTAEPEGSSAGSEEVRSKDGLTAEQMLLLLKAEEPPVARGVNALALAVSGTILVFGAVLMIWGIVAFVATRGASDPRGTWGSGTMILFGVMFMALGGWQGYKAMEKRGVL